MTSIDYMAQASQQVAQACGPAAGLGPTSINMTLTHEKMTRKAICDGIRFRTLKCPFVWLYEDNLSARRFHGHIDPLLGKLPGDLCL